MPTIDPKDALMFEVERQRVGRTLAQWLAGTRTVEAPLHRGVAIGIHDTRTIEHTRTYLWDLSDYAVESVTGGVIWLRPIRSSLG